MTFLRSTALLDEFWAEVAKDDARKSGRNRPPNSFHPSAGIAS